MIKEIASKMVVPEPFYGKRPGEVETWFRRFEHCSTANGCNAAARLARLPTLLDGLSFAKFELLSAYKIDTYDHAKSALIDTFCPKQARLEAKRQFRRRALRLGEDIDSFVYDI